MILAIIQTIALLAGFIFLWQVLKTLSTIGRELNMLNIELDYIHEHFVKVLPDEVAGVDYVHLPRKESYAETEWRARKQANKIKAQTMAALQKEAETNGQPISKVQAMYEVEKFTDGVVHTRRTYPDPKRLRQENLVAENPQEGIIPNREDLVEDVTVVEPMPIVKEDGPFVMSDDVPDGNGRTDGVWKPEYGAAGGPMILVYPEDRYDDERGLYL